jgi:hypothetical protein
MGTLIAAAAAEPPIKVRREITGRGGSQTAPIGLLILRFSIILSSQKTYPSTPLRVKCFFTPSEDEAYPSHNTIISFLIPAGFVIIFG